MDSHMAAMILSDDLLVDTDWVQELHSPEREGPADNSANGTDQQPTSTSAAAAGAADPPIPSGVVLSQRLRAMPKPTLPLPWSADDINPVPWRRTTTEWLPGSFMPEQAPEPSIPWPPAALNPEAAAAVAAAKAKPLDLRTLSQAKLLAASRKHNSTFNIYDPVGAVLDGVRENAVLNDPSRNCHPFTLGGNPVKDEYSRAWSMVMKNGPGPALDDGRKQHAGRPAPAAGRQSSLEYLTRTPSNAAAGAPSSSARGTTPPLPSAAAAAAAAGPAPKVAYGTLTEEQLRFTNLLSSFLEVTVKLPLLAPGAQALDLKRLYMEVNGVGGFNAACSSDAWPQLASSLQNDSKLGHILKQVYAYYLLPVEEVMPAGVARNARLVEVLEARVRDNDALPPLRSNVRLRPVASNVTKALAQCADGLRKWRAAPPLPVAEAAGRLLALEREGGGQEQQGRGQGPAEGQVGSSGQAANGLAQGQQQAPVKQEQGAGGEQAGAPAAAPAASPAAAAAAPSASPAVAAAPAAGSTAAATAAAFAVTPLLAVRFARHVARSFSQCCDDKRPLQLELDLGTTGLGPAAGTAAGAAGTGAGASAVADDMTSAEAGTRMEVDSNGETGGVDGRQEATGDQQAGVKAPSSPATAAAGGETSSVRLTWSEVQPLNALLLSYRQLKAGPAVLRRPAPRLKEHYLAQIRPSGSGGGAADQGLTSGPWIVREEEPRGVEEQKPAAGKRLFTPRCGNCRTCNNLSLKKACETNRARMSENLEPIFHTEEARLAYQAKRAKFE